ncbi:MAG TPA: CAP domain-containing protein [Kofleriaceae bacterium]|nr:CAP domain-containing protein [Kofleriaceae bacterium]
MRCLLLTATALAACHAPVATTAPAPAAAPDLATTQFIAGYADHPIAPLALEPPTKLDAIAAVAARSAADAHVISARALHEAMARELGSGLWPYVLTAWGDETEITAQLEAALAELRATTDVATVGTARASGRAGSVGVVIALPPPVLPLVVGRDTNAARISMPWPWQDEPAAFVVTATSAKRLAPTSVARQGAELALVVDCTRPAAVEVRAGARIVANVVDACGEPVLVDPAGVIAPDARLDYGPPARTRIEIEMRIFELMNRERAIHDLPPLAWDAAAHAFARVHAVEMAGGAYISHEAPDGAHLPERVERGGLHGKTNRENVGHAWGPGEVHDAFMASRGHRANVLAVDVERGAIGIAFDPADPRAFYVTEVFRTP